MAVLQLSSMIMVTFSRQLQGYGLSQTFPIHHAPLDTTSAISFGVGPSLAAAQTHDDFVVPPPEIKAIIDKLAFYVAKNGDVRLKDMAENIDFRSTCFLSNQLNII